MFTEWVLILTLVRQDIQIIEGFSSETSCKVAANKWLKGKADIDGDRYIIKDRVFATAVCVEK